MATRLIKTFDITIKITDVQNDELKKFFQLGETLVEPYQELQTLKTKGKPLRQSNKGIVQV